MLTKLWRDFEIRFTFINKLILELLSKVSKINGKGCAPVIVEVRWVWIPLSSSKDLNDCLQLKLLPCCFITWNITAFFFYLFLQRSLYVWVQTLQKMVRLQLETPHEGISSHSFVYTINSSTYAMHAADFTKLTSLYCLFSIFMLWFIANRFSSCFGKTYSVHWGHV